ncbi:hypothetical protein B0H14DRAFT_3745931 [Mycena olivaceomarginata]|nr:hypothetical protein B0H14DRAFT_3745931 [Mycena olivaceomarginata]
MPLKEMQPPKTPVTAAGPENNQKAVWLTPDNRALLTFLADHMTEAGDGGNFKTKTFHAAAAAAAVNAVPTKGGPKTPKSCSQKHGTEEVAEYS